MTRICPKCEVSLTSYSSYGYFTRNSDKRRIGRFKCPHCQFVFSQATFQSCYRQKKRKLNAKILELLCSGVSQRRIAKLLSVNRKTVARKLIFLASRTREVNLKRFQNL